MTVKVKAFLARGPVFGLLLCSPALLLMAFVLVYPLLRSISLSFQRMNLVYPGLNDPFVGLENYIRLFTLEPYFAQILATTALFVIVTVLCGFSLGFMLALILQRVRRTRVILQALFLLPYVVPSVALTLLWMWMFNPTFGVVNYVLQELHLIDQYKRWFVDPNLALVPLMAITVWKGGAFNMIILYAGLQNIPVELYEAASIDGGSARQKFRYVTLPQMRPVITVLLLLSSMYLMQFFTPIWILTRGGPGFSTTTLSIYIYRIAFERYDFGLASALGTLWFIFLMIVTFIILRLSRRRD